MRIRYSMTALATALALAGCGGGGGGGGDSGAGAGGGGGGGGTTTSAFNDSIARVVQSANADSAEPLDVAAVLPVGLASGPTAEDDTREPDSININ